MPASLQAEASNSPAQSIDTVSFEEATEQTGYVDGGVVKAHYLIDSADSRRWERWPRPSPDDAGYDDDRSGCGGNRRDP